MGRYQESDAVGHLTVEDRMIHIMIPDIVLVAAQIVEDLEVEALHQVYQVRNSNLETYKKLKKNNNVNCTKFMSVSFSNRKPW